MSSKVKEVETSQQNQWTYRTIQKPLTVLTQNSILNTQNYRALRTKDQEPRLEYWVTRIDDQELRIKLLQELFEDLEILYFWENNFFRMPSWHMYLACWYLQDHSPTIQ